MKLNIALCVLSAASIMSCTKSSKSSSSRQVVMDANNSDEFRSLVSMSDMGVPSRFQDFSKEEIVSEVNSIDDFFNDESSYGLTATSGDDCSTVIEKNTLLAASDKIVKFEGYVNDTSCFKNSDIKAFEFKSLIYAYCESGGLSKFNGKSAHNLDDRGVCINTNQAMLTSAITTSTYIVPQLGNMEVNLVKKVLFSDPSGKACHSKYSGGKMLDSDGCIDISVTNYNSTGVRPDYTKLTYKGLTYTREDQKYYDTGTIEFVIGDWKGTMTYTGADTPPTWTATNGTDTLKDQTFNYSSSGLVGSKKDKHAPQIKWNKFKF